ncbi:hypothetical protein SAMN02745728_01128 [Desulfovibrio litoralis DSM 11393]|uniref:Uncharacterized protein n=1 Tax=Desulfovibrio litoralis DSM 11393 TaxID=1121455 RepID=A0A1M7SPT9_9BACT|nr:hypothetical protein SAMN02745728_01128 [Desulfovibrio litoralis DSM 11393]
MKIRKLFVSLFILCLAYFICISLAFIVFQSIPSSGSEETGGHKLTTVIAYIFINIVLFLGIALLGAGNNIKLIKYSIVVILVELLITFLVYMYNLHYYAGMHFI